LNSADSNISAIQAGVGRGAWAQAALLMFLFAAVFGPTWAWAVGIWSRSEFYSHGFLILPISVFLAWRLWQSRPTPAGSTAPGILLVLVSAAIHLVARKFDVWFPSAFAFVGVLAGTLWWLGGWSTFRHFWFPVLFLVFAIPLERFLVLQFAQPLQLSASTTAAAIARGAGLPVSQMGTTLRMPDYTFEIAIPCSGLKSGIAMSALGALLGYILVGPWWGRLALFLLSIPMALVANVARVVITLVLARAVGPAAADGFLHTFSGLMVFALALAGLFGLSRIFSCKGIRTDF